MKRVLIALAFICCALALATPTHNQFLNFMEKHNKAYKSDRELLYRYEIFKSNLNIINELNNEEGATFAVNEFADLSPEEFRELYLMKDMGQPPLESEEVYDEILIGAPSTFDWRSKGGVTPVKNQGQCGSCWAFSAVENIESVYHLAGNPLPTLSPQQVVDCDHTCYGCQGGWPYRAFKYVIGAGGIENESHYPYTARDGSCKFKDNYVTAKIKSYETISKNEQTIQSALVNKAPLSICVDASKWQFYNSGVMTHTQCSRHINHCVQLVGYDSTASVPFWQVRNSWGTSWGINGYIHLEMWQDTCAMAESVTTAVA